jgi:pheromone shutdown protein TraB
VINTLSTGKITYKNDFRVIQTMSKVLPDVKRVMIDKKEEELYEIIRENKGKVMVAVVNQIHMEGIEHHWCHSYGQLPRNMRHDNIDPIGDMPLRKMIFQDMYHVIMRDIVTSRAKTTPSSYTNVITPYHRESNFQYEHRNM